MTINHIFLWATAKNLPALRTFYSKVLAPVGYTELICAYNSTLIGFGSDYPYFWIKALPEGNTTMPVHVAFDAPTWGAVEEFHRLALESGAKDNGGPGIREEMSRYPYYAAFAVDMEGNNVEAVCAPREARKR
ncbi:glyoxalase/bleomycin resistance protein/dioxygenase [Aspergillus japonicus CBS 114.51]|uniref:Glyoxalase/bleomycin resistance protein/dioxygenase n=2 Tax=Aspergillus TaxID=5052 RepID=A0A2V5H6E9_ASPV1|nr:glyoxalase/bleomycin resistance protein/dioxygenase [Aspergillus japonicus CBS 114.51]PYI17214.1 glyoxalase/bleomycin resistance protein/dioxygenase [Aspergillus violaceofuscus CBS 115571]RAH79932.1 glyoxalase/bleomycin resistance protein/dioxygenase [Aspergillus japonicus CBS 114.51]